MNRIRPATTADVRDLQCVHGVSNMRDMLALAPGNDPFNCDTPSGRRDGRWFADIWEQFGCKSGAHLRQIHYRILSERIKDVDGDVYENTERCWHRLASASASARSLGMVPADAFDDKRNKDPIIFTGAREFTTEPHADYPEPEDGNPFELPAISVDISQNVYLKVPEPVVSGFDYLLSDQRYHLELWVEKSTMNPVLEPVCRQYGMVLVEGVGFQSITSAIQLLQRANGRPVRVFYVSDFDPAGQSMARAVARQVEFNIPRYAPDIDIRIEQIALTREQVEEFDLPRIPIKESDRRRENFETENGAGAVELDALEALHPGSLAKIAREAAERYYDDTLHWRLNDTAQETQSALHAEWYERTGLYAEELEAMGRDVRDRALAYKDELQALADRWNAEMAPYHARLEQVWDGILDAAEDMDTHIPDRPEGRIVEEDDNVLFDSNRDYMTQLQYYKKGKISSTKRAKRRRARGGGDDGAQGEGDAE